MTNKNISVFGFDECPFCSDLKNKLIKQEIKFTYHDIDTDEGNIEYEKILKYAKSEYLPLIVVDYTILTADKSFDSIDNAIELINQLIKK